MQFLVSHDAAAAVRVAATTPKQAAELLNLGIRPRITIVTNLETGEESVFFPPWEDA